MIKKARDMYLNEVPLHELTQEIEDAIMMFYDECEHCKGLKKLKSNITGLEGVICTLQGLISVLNEKVKRDYM